MTNNRQFLNSIRPKTSFSVKLTAYFIIFGVIIGYAVFIFSTAYNRRRTLETFSESVLNEFDFNKFVLKALSDDIG